MTAANDDQMGAMLPQELLSTIPEMVESYWRTFLTIGTPDPALALEVSRLFETRVNEIATGLGGAAGQEFLQAVERERERLLQEYEADHAGFRRRLGVPPLPSTESPVHHQASIGETVVRTAVRATVWESVRALFRAFR
jgi:hypothetical protein